MCRRRGRRGLLRNLVHVFPKQSHVQVQAPMQDTRVKQGTLAIGQIRTKVFYYIRRNIVCTRRDTIVTSSLNFDHYDTDRTPMRYESTEKDTFYADFHYETRNKNVRSYLLAGFMEKYFSTRPFIEDAVNKET